MNTHGPWVIMQPTLPPILMTSTHYIAETLRTKGNTNMLDFFSFAFYMNIFSLFLLI